MKIRFSKRESLTFLSFPLKNTFGKTANQNLLASTNLCPTVIRNCLQGQSVRHPLSLQCCSVNLVFGTEQLRFTFGATLLQRSLLGKLGQTPSFFFVITLKYLFCFKIKFLKYWRDRCQENRFRIVFKPTLSDRTSFCFSEMWIFMFWRFRVDVLGDIANDHRYQV